MAASYIITPEKAIELVEAYTQELKPMAEKESLGGTIRKPSIDGKMKAFNGRPYTGNMAWYCYNHFDNPDFPKFFLSFEENNDYEKDQAVVRPDSSELICPVKASCFTYDKRVTVENLIRKDVRTINSLMDQRISRSMVEQFCSNFTFFSSAGTINRYPYGFFENMESDDVATFLNQPNIQYIRYYFGYGREDHYKESRVRIILVGVDKDGKNLVPLDSKMNDGSIILQKSWPPPTSL